MASRVNKRFVIILIVGVFALLGMLVAALSVVHKSAGELAGRGDDFMKQGDYKQAERAYSKAVNKDSTNPDYIDKWIDSITKLIPETETEYNDRFSGDYMGAISKKATILRNDIDAHERFIAIRFEILKANYGRGIADAIIQDTNSALAFFDGDPSEVHEWERLKRYRGLALVDIARNNGVLDDNQFTLAQDDLERAIAANPDDADSVIGLMNINTIIDNRKYPEHNTEARKESLKSNLRIADRFLESHPRSATMKIQRVLLSADIGRRDIVETLASDQQAQAINTLYRSYQTEMTAIANELMGDARSELNYQTVNLYALLESAINPDANRATTRKIVDMMIDSDKENGELIWIAARIAEATGEYEEAIGWYSRIGDLKTKPMSYAGLRQYTIQRQAMYSQASIRVDQAELLPADASETDKAAAIAKAVSNRDRYATAVTEGDGNLILIDGKIARLKGNLDESLRLFKKYNELFQRNSPEGLWQEAITAFQIGQLGVARDALYELIPIDTNSERKLRAMLTLAQVNMRLKDYAVAAQLFKDILVVSPNLPIALEGLDSVNKLLNPELNEDPVTAAIYTARQLRTGTSEIPGDYAGAIQYLRENIEALNYDPRLARTLASLLFENDDIEGSRLVIARSFETHPNDESLKAMMEILKSNDPVSIRVALVRDAPISEFDMLISIAQIASENQRMDLLQSTIDDMTTIAPNDKRTIEWTFINALMNKDIELAQQIASRTDLSRVDSLSFQARIATTNGDAERAISLLEQAAASGTADASVYQMLAVIQRETGKLEPAIRSFEKALSIRPDNAQVITEYIMTLIRANKFEEALSAARRMQRHGSSVPAFMNIWLNLESIYGGAQGRSFAIRQRERLLELNPTNIDNKFQLARMYIGAKQWNDAKQLVDQLRAQDDQLSFVELEATWYADQGMYNNQNGLLLANDVFAKYIESLPAPVDASPYVSNSQFMLNRGRPDLAVIAANEAVKRQAPETMIGSRLLGDLYMSINNYSDAVIAYQAVVDGGADTDFSVRNRLVENLVRLERFDEAQVVYNQLPAEMKLSMISMLQSADIARGLDQNAKASQILNDAVARYPTDATVYVKRAESMIGDETLLNDLLSDVGRAIDLQANDWRAYRVRAAGFFAVGRKDDALKDLRTTIRLNPNLDQSIYSLLNELLSQDGRAGEALDLAREVVDRRPDDANLMSRIGGLFASRSDWNRAAELYKLAWDKRHSVNDGAVYIDSLVRKSPPDANAANDVINELANIVGNIDQSAGLLAASALVLQARGRDDFGQQQITKAFDLSVNKDEDLLSWSGNLSRYFESEPASAQVQYLEALKRRNANVDVQAWLDLFIARRLLTDDLKNAKANQIIARLEQYTNKEIQLRAFRVHGSSLFSAGQYQAAVDVWEVAIKLFPQDWELNNNLAYTLSSKLDRSDEALAFAQAALDQNIPRSEAYETMASIYVRLAQYDKAKEMIDLGARYIQSIPSRVTMVLTEGRLELAQGKTLEARSKLNEARSVLRSSPSADETLKADIDAFEAELNSGNG